MEIWIYSMGSAIALALIVSSVQYTIRLKAPTLDGLFDSIAPTLFPDFQAFRISGALTYLGNRCELPGS
jgi:hypothetical protein